MANEPVNLEFVIKAINEVKAGVDAAVADFKKLSGTVDTINTKVDKLGGSQQHQRVSGLHTRITQLTHAFRKLGIELETIDLYFISGFKVLGLIKLIGYTKEAILQSETYANTLRGIAAVARQEGVAVEDVFVTINNLAKDGLVSVQGLAQAMRSLLKVYSLEDATKLVEALKVTGVGLGTQKQMPLEEAVPRAAEGIRMWISTLSDATMVTENLDSMVAKYAKTLGMLPDNLNESQKYQAVLNGFVKEASGITDSYSQAIEGFTGKMAKLNYSLVELKNNIGQGLIPFATNITEILTTASKGLNTFLFTLEKYVMTVGTRFEKFKLMISNIFSWTTMKEQMDYLNNQYEIAVKELEAKYGIGSKLKGQQVEISSVFRNLPERKADTRMNTGYPSLGQVPWWNKPEEGFNVDFSKMIDAEKAEQMRKLGEKMAQSFSYAFERGISDVFFNLFTGEKSSFIDMARNFGRSLARAISDAMAEAMIAPVKSWMSGLFSGLLSVGTTVATSGLTAGTPGSSTGSLGDFFKYKSNVKPVNITIGNGLTPREVGDIVTKELTDSYGRNSSVRKVIKGQR